MQRNNFTNTLLLRISTCLASAYPKTGLRTTEYLGAVRINCVVITSHRGIHISELYTIIRHTPSFKEHDRKVKKPDNCYRCLAFDLEHNKLCESGYLRRNSCVPDFRPISKRVIREAALQVSRPLLFCEIARFWLMRVINLMCFSHLLK